jgi:hypothetical protein
MGGLASHGFQDTRHVAAAQLVHLDRVDRGIAAGVIPVADGLGERGLHVRQPVGQDVGKTHQQRQPQAVGAGAFHDRRQRQRRATRAARLHHHFAGGAHVHIAIAPVRHGIGVAGVVGSPLFRHRCHLLCSRR